MLLTFMGGNFSYAPGSILMALFLQTTLSLINFMDYITV
jgi:hypothetical protein